MVSILCKARWKQSGPGVFFFWNHFHAGRIFKLNLSTLINMVRAMVRPRVRARARDRDKARAWARDRARADLHFFFTSPLNFTE